MRLYKEVDYNVIPEAFTLINHFGPRLSLSSHICTVTPLLMAISYDGKKKIECTIFLFNRGGQ